ncbi:MAG: hypothetical protein HN498_03105 [Flavobacteriales bacterium]|jgi:hypothetical protein|nr:hypothetical protein [Flavobacteriales bacterium]MBT6965256.1 hypothetical protein [Flavobacteriales bacterium]
MKRIITIVLLSVSILSVDAQVDKLAGPRVGVTMVQAGSLASILRKDVSLFSDDIREEWTGSIGKNGAVMSQYGWQWESRFLDGGDVVGIVEWIALVGGMEKGMFLPSVSSMVGLRTASGFEFAAGPNLSLGGIAMVIGIGKTLKFGKLNVPVNIAYVPSMNKTYHHDAEEEYLWHEGYYDYVYDENGDINWQETTYTDGYDELISSTPAYTVSHPTGARISVMVGFNLGK